ncbi:MAG: DUF2399 domain-containing protein [Clostridia bacterium]|nr:DUF2399 domain-containing protein [Clostridia bacterium]
MDKLGETISYFKENAGYNRLLNGMKEKYISLGKITGNVIINKPSIQEKQALSGLMKKDYSRNMSISINLLKLQQRIDESKFSGVQLQDILNSYFCQGILTKKEELQNKKDELENFFEKILRKNENTYMYGILAQSMENKNSLYQTIKRYYKENKEETEKEFITACQGINYIRNARIKEKIRIPVFATEIASNPHKFDKKTLCGKLFIQLLCYINNQQYPRNSEELAELYYNNGLLVDDVSNMVLCKNLVGYKQVSKAKKENSAIEIAYKENSSIETKYEVHQGLDGFYKYNEPVYLTLYNLSNISSIRRGKYNKVLITENPAVFMEIIKQSELKDFPLICTYGQVKLAGIMLMDLLVAEKYQLYYSGDLDPEGIQIADKLKQRYNESLTFIGFDKRTYYRNISEVEISQSRLQKLKNIKSLELNEVCEEIQKVKKAGYEEKNINHIVEYLLDSQQ